MTFPIYIDNTIRKAFATCPMKANRAYVQDLRQAQDQSVDLVFGGAFARGLEVARKEYFYNGNYESAVRLGQYAAADFWTSAGTIQIRDKCYKNLDRLIGALSLYFGHWPMGEDGLTPVEGGIECAFQLMLPIANPDAPHEYLKYVGRFDMLATDPQRRYYIMDDKTASRLGDTWDMQWDMDSQISGYFAGARNMLVKQGISLEGIEMQGLIRGISILKNDYGCTEVPLTRTSWFIQQWYRQLLRDVTRMIASYKNDEWDKAMNSSCTNYARRCEYMTLCLSPDPERIIADPTVYVVRHWNPVTREET